MAVYTKIDRQDLETHLQKYQIGELLDFKGIVEGIDNSNYLISTSSGKFIFTIFESRIDKNTLPYFIDLKRHLSLKNIPCPKPIANKKQETITDFKDKKTAIVTFLEGANLKPDEDGFYRNINSQHCFQIGEMLAKMHTASSDYKNYRKNDLAIDGLEQLFQKFKHLLKDYDQSLLELIPQNIELIKTNWNVDLQASACHLDLFPDNVFFNNEKISGVIDFYFSANDLLIYDFAIVVNAWCFDETKFNYDKFISLLGGYQKVRLFKNDELNFLQNALLCASMRFLITRLHDYFFTPKDSLVKIKNPQEYKEKLLFFTQNKIN